MGFKAFTASRIISHGHIHSDVAVLVEHGLVKGLCALRDIPVAAERVDHAGLTLAAGLVDAQVNGGGGVLLNDYPDEKGIVAIASAHMKAGTTALLPTMISDTTDKITHVMDAARQVMAKQSLPSILGIHLEGPFLNPARSGIHEKNAIENAPHTYLNDLKLDGMGICMMTVAPEMFAKGDLAKLAAKGAILAAGHSAANKEQLAAAKAEGLTGVTHLYNAMGGMSARDTGLSGAALGDDQLWCSIIADGAHVAPDMLRIANRAKPHGKLFLVSDAMPPAAQNPPQPFMLQGKRITTSNGRCVDEHGHLAGSCFTLLECVRYAVQQAGFTLEHAVAMASLYPAQFLKCDDKIGSLQEGRRADMIAFDNAMKLERVYSAGRFI